jgi:Tripartite tricarboxylate transporter family receptor
VAAGIRQSLHGPAKPPIPSALISLLRARKNAINASIASYNGPRIVYVCQAFPDAANNANSANAGSRRREVPDIPTFCRDGLPAPTCSGWYGLFAPRGIPRDIIGKLNAFTHWPIRRWSLELSTLGLKFFHAHDGRRLGALRKVDAENWWPIIKELEIRHNEVAGSISGSRLGWRTRDQV